MTARTITTVISFVITFALIGYYLAFSDVDLGEVKNLLKEVSLPGLGAFLILSFAMSFFRTWRYLVLLRATNEEPPKIPLFLITLVRNLFADLLPARIGTAIYVVLVTTRLKIPFPAAASSFAVAFLFDLLALPPLLLFAFAFVPDQAPWLVFASVILGVVSLAVLILLPWLISLSRPVFEAILAFLPKYREKLTQMITEVHDELEATRKAGVYGRVFLLSVFVRITKYASLLIFLLAMLIPLGYFPEELPLASLLLAICGAELSASLPISGIAGFGAYEGTWIVIFSKLLEFPIHIAELTAIAHHAFTQFYGYALGLGALALLSVPIWRIQKQEPRPLSSLPAFLTRVAGFSTAVLAAVVIIIGDPPKAASQPTPKGQVKLEKSQRQALKQLRQDFPYQVVFDSNRNGTFGIYRTDLSGMQPLEVIDSSQYHEMYPSFSPDGTKLVFARHHTLSRLEAGEVWIMDLQDGSVKQLANNATFPTFSSDGRSVFFERKRRVVVKMELESGESEQIFPENRRRFERGQVVKPKISPDEKQIAFTADNPQAWFAWQASLVGKRATRLGNGCEPTWFHKRDEIIYVNRQGKAKSGLFRIKPDGSGYEEVIDRPDPWGHEYFPAVTPDDRFVLYSASPSEDDHSHYEANYQLFVKGLEGESEPVRVSFDEATNRWPTAARPEWFKP